MERVYLDCTGLPHSIPVRSEIPNTIYIDASNLQTVLDNFLQVLPNVISEGLKANPLEQRVMQIPASPVAEGRNKNGKNIKRITRNNRYGYTTKR
jgi:hypothetical protein